MTAQKYEISPKELKNFPWVSAANKWNIFELEKRKFVSPSSHGMFYILYKHQWNTKPFHFNFFWCKRCNILCSHSNSDLFTCEDIMFLRKSSPGISLAFTEWIMFSGQGFELPLHMTNFVEATTILLRKKKKNFYQTKAAPPKHLANHESHSKQMSLSKEAC